MQTFIQFLLHHRRLTLFVAIIVCLLGIFAWNELTIEAYPDISDIEVSIITQVEGLPAEEMELQIAVPIERSLNTVPGVIAKRSRTIFGLSIVKLAFDDKTNIYLARQLIMEKLKSVALPYNASPELGPMTSSIGEIFRYVIEAPENIPLTYLRELQEYLIVPKLLQANGVVDVANFGGLIRQYQIIINPLELEKYNLSLTHIEDAIKANNENVGASYTVVGSSQLNIRGIGRITKAEDIENIIVSTKGGVPILIKDIARVELGFKPPSGILSYVDKKRNTSSDRGIEGIVLLRKFENPSNTILSVYEKIEELNKYILPPDIKVHPLYDRTQLVSLTIKTVITTLSEGTIVVFIVLTLLIGSWKAALISSLAIPFSLLFAFVCMYITGIPANLLSLGAIDFGIIVDATIVMIEGIFRHLQINHLQKQQKTINQLIIKASDEVQVQILFAVGIIILALLPILTLQRVEGRMFSPMAWTLSFAIFGSMVFSLTIAPVLFSFMIKDSDVHEENRIWLKIQSVYALVLKYCLYKARTVVGLSFLFTFVIIMAGYGIGKEFLPELDEGSIWIRVFLPAGISIQAAKKYPDKIKDELKNYDEIETILCQLGRNDDGTDPYGPNRLEVLLQLKQPYSNWKDYHSKKTLILSIKNKLDTIIPGASFSISQPIIDTTTENATGSSADLAIFINGRDLDVLRETGEKILQLVRNTSGASESAIEQEKKQSQIVIKVDRKEAARFGINVQDVNEILRLAIAGLPISQLYENERRFDIVLRFTKESRNTVANIGKILIPTKTGFRIPLSLVAEIKLEEGETIIYRENGYRQITVKTNIRGRDQESFAKEIREKINKDIKLAENVTFTLGGQFENLQRASKRLSYIVPLTLVLIYITLLYYFKNKYLYALIVMGNIPFAVVGGIMALYFRGMYFSISAGVGFVSLFGISVMSGVLLISYLNRLKLDPDVGLNSIILEGSVIQFKPRFLVMTIAIIGLLPAAFNTGIGSDVQRPLATVIVGGLCSSMVLTLFVSPALYLLVERYSKHK